MANDNAARTTDAQQAAPASRAEALNNVINDCWGPFTSSSPSAKDVLANQNFEDRGQTGLGTPRATLDVTNLWEVGPDDKVNLVDTSKYESRGGCMGPGGLTGKVPDSMKHERSNDLGFKLDTDKYTEKGGCMGPGGLTGQVPDSMKHERTKIAPQFDAEKYNNLQNAPNSGRTEMRIPALDRHEPFPIRYSNGQIKRH